MRDIDHIIVHCAATTPEMDIGATEIDKWHRAKGWWGCGYHYVIRRNGLVEYDAKGDRTRPLNKAGAHVGDCGPGWNSRALGVCLVGGIDDNGDPAENFTNEQWVSLEATLRFLLASFPGSKIMGHRDLIKLTGASPKACPSFEVADFKHAVGLPD